MNSQVARLAKLTDKAQKAYKLFLQTHDKRPAYSVYNEYGILNALVESTELNNTYMTKARREAGFTSDIFISQGDGAITDILTITDYKD